ncbi:MAG: cell division protein FtsA, partial [Rhodospirillales bacterium]|nr:cell division protein FtsA [Rhodospirillales bacterium]
SVLDKQIRLGRPLKIAGLADSTGGPAFTACAGLLAFAVRRPDEAPETTQTIGTRTGMPTGPLGRVGLWLRENF